MSKNSVTNTSLYFFIGLQNSGKTSIAKALAASGGDGGGGQVDAADQWAVVDIDAEMVHAFNVISPASGICKTISQVYGFIGGPGFRKLEYEILRHILSSDTPVTAGRYAISCGGGVFDTTEACRLLRPYWKAACAQKSYGKWRRVTFVYIHREPQEIITDMMSGARKNDYGNGRQTNPDKARQLPMFLRDSNAPDNEWLRIAKKRQKKYDKFATLKLDSDSAMKSLHDVHTLTKLVEGRG